MYRHGHPGSPFTQDVLGEAVLGTGPVNDEDFRAPGGLHSCAGAGVRLLEGMRHRRMSPRQEDRV